MSKFLWVLFTIVALASGKSVVLTLDAPASDISGLAWGGNSLWALSAATRYVFRLDPATGEVLSSFHFNFTESMTATGLTYSESYNRVLCAGWAGYSGYVYQYTPEGNFITKINLVGG